MDEPLPIEQHAYVANVAAGVAPKDQIAQEARFDNRPAVDLLTRIARERHAHAGKEHLDKP